jgi:hypothetical protein
VSGLGAHASAWRHEKIGGLDEPTEDGMTTGSQCRAARSLVEITCGKLGIRSGIDKATPM